MLAADWAEGFMDAFGLRVDAWDALFEDEDGQWLLAPIMAHLHDKDGQPLIDGSPEETQEIQEECLQSGTGPQALPFDRQRGRALG